MIAQVDRSQARHASHPLALWGMGEEDRVLAIKIDLRFKIVTARWLPIARIGRRENCKTKQGEGSTKRRSTIAKLEVSWSELVQLRSAKLLDLQSYVEPWCSYPE